MYEYVAMYQTKMYQYNLKYGRIDTFFCVSLI